MKKVFTFIMVALLCASVNAQNLEKLWSSTYSWNPSGNTSRDAAVYDGKMYVVYNNAASSAIYVIDGATGDEIAGEKFSSAEFTGYAITVDNAGNLLVPKNTGGGGNWALNKVNIATRTVGQLAAFNASSTRIDYPRVFGNIESATEPAYVMGASSATLFNILAWEVMAGVRTATPVLSFDRGYVAAAGDIKQMDDTHFLLTQQSVTPYVLTVDFAANPYITKVEQIELLNPQGFGGGDYFKLGGIPYMVIPRAAASANAGFGPVGVFNISDITAPKQVGSFTGNIAATTVTNGAAHVAVNAIKTANNEVTVYIFAPNNGAAAYKAVCVETPELTPAAGEYSGASLDITLIKSATEGAKIYYTIDGSTPTTSSTLYDGSPITLAGSPEGETTTIKILATATGLFDNLSEATYIVTGGVGIQKVKVLDIQAKGGEILVPATSGTIEVFSVLGQKVKSVAAQGDATTISGLLPGQIYIVKVNGQTAKVIL